MKTFFGVALLALLNLSSAQVIAGGDAKAGKAKAAICSACHGVEGISSNPEWPNLAGQHEGYLVAQTTAFRDGVRENVLMAPMVASLSDQDILDIAAYFSSIEIPHPKDPAPDAVGRNHVAVCVSCHGMYGLTVSPDWPNLAGQQETYLANQLRAFRDGSRQNPVMSQMAKPLTDKQIDEIANYYSGLK